MKWSTVNWCYYAWKFLSHFPELQYLSQKTFWSPYKQTSVMSSHWFSDTQSLIASCQGQFYVWSGSCLHRKRILCHRVSKYIYICLKSYYFKVKVNLNKIYISHKIELPSLLFYQYHSKILVFRDHNKTVHIKITRSLNDCKRSLNDNSTYVSHLNLK